LDYLGCVFIVFIYKNFIIWLFCLMGFCYFYDTGAARGRIGRVIAPLGG
jgi:hypothetical protein